MCIKNASEKFETFCLLSEVISFSLQRKKTKFALLTRVFAADKSYSLKGLKRFLNKCLTQKPGRYPALSRHLRSLKLRPLFANIKAWKWREIPASYYGSYICLTEPIINCFAKPGKDYVFRDNATYLPIVCIWL